MQTSRKEIYSYVATLLTSVTKNIYRVSVPVTLSTDAISNGFIVLNLDGMRGFSEFDSDTYGQIRMYVMCYSPSTNTSTINGIMNTTKFDAMQSAVDAIIKAECAKENQTYNISREGVLSYPDDFYSNKTNSFYVYMTSFLITI